MKKLLFITISSLIVTGCATQPTHNGRLNDPSNMCEMPVERNLTVTYQDRSYWCAPKAYIQDLPKPRPAYYETPTKKEESTPIIVEFTEQDYFNQVNEIIFYDHDNSYDKNSLTALLNTRDNLKLRGCRLSGEQTALTLGRPLRVKNDLISSGFTYKITILSDKSCLGKKSVEVV